MNFIVFDVLTMVNEANTTPPNIKVHLVYLRNFLNVSKVVNVVDVPVFDVKVFRIIVGIEDVLNVNRHVFYERFKRVWLVN